MRSLILAAALIALSANAQAQPVSLPNVHVVNSPNTLGWPVTLHVSSVDVQANGVKLTFAGCDALPPVTPPGWGGPLFYTLHLFLNVGGEWWESGIIQFWACDQYSGGAIYEDNQIARNWVYDSRWGNMNGHQPAPGELIGFMVSAGNARGQDDHVLAARSGVVGVNMPTGSGIAPIVWQEATSLAPVPVPTPVLPPTVVCPDLGLTAMINARFDRVESSIAAFRADEQSNWSNVKNAFAEVLKNPYFQTAVASFGTWAITHQATKP